VQSIVDAGRVVAFCSGQQICKQGDPGDSMFIILEGRVKVVVSAYPGQEVFLDYLGEGAHFGELSLLNDERRSATVSAVMDTRLLALQHDRFHDLTLKVAGFTANLCRSLGKWLRRSSPVKRRRSRPAVIALAGTTPSARALVHALAATLAGGGKAILVLTDGDEIPDTAGYTVQSLIPKGTRENCATAFHAHLAGALARHERVLVSLVQRGGEGEWPRLLAQCEEIWWVMEPQDLEASQRRLESLLRAAPGLSARVHLVWLRREDAVVPVVDTGALGIAATQFKLALEGGDDRPFRFPQRDLVRLVHHLQRIRLGLALGGGGARAAAHAGVLRAFERAEIYPDILAGTSGGAFVALAYAAGCSTDRIVEIFRDVMAPGRFLSALPWGGRWHMWMLYRFGGWRRRTQNCFPNCTFEQMYLPLFLVTVDLVTGNCVVRERGSATDALLESINLPGIARPILRDGAALVDGGVLNNVPGDVVRERGADMVVGIDVSLKLPQKFGRNLPTTPAQQMHYPGFMQTMLRVVEVQQYGLVSARDPAIDLLIAPDNSAVDLTDFGKAQQIADVGEAEGEKSVPAVKKLLAELEGE
jgi:predicted acylesterase/phospholipase RssA/CRP-like cAMP-binding protein